MKIPLSYTNYFYTKIRRWYNSTGKEICNALKHKINEKSLEAYWVTDETKSNNYWWTEDKNNDKDRIN